MKVWQGYLARVPRYTYDMPCGHRFRSYTPSTSESGWHRFPCACGLNHAVRVSELVEHRPLSRPKGISYEAKDGRPDEAPPPPLPDGRLAYMFDRALIRDRIAQDLFRADWTAEELAERHGVSVRLVKQIGVEIRVYDSD